MEQIEDPENRDDVMKGGDRGGQAKTELETHGNVENEADEGKEDRHKSLAGKLAADRRTDLDRLANGQGIPCKMSMEKSQERLCHRVGGLASGLHPNKEIGGSVDILDLRPGKSIAGKDRPNFGNGFGAIKMDEKGRPPGKVDSQVGLSPGNLEQGKETDQNQQGRKPQGNFLLSHEVDGRIADQFEHG